MKNEGARLKAIAKGKGYTAKSLADRLGVTPLTVENDFKAQSLTRRVISKYQEILGIDIDRFYEQKPILYEQKQVEPESGKQDSLLVELKYKDELLRAKEETIVELRKTIDTLNGVIRFFPNAVVPVTVATA